MNIIQQVKSQVDTIKTIAEWGIGGGTTYLSVEQFITETTPILQYIGLVAGILLSITLLIKAWKPKKKKKKNNKA